MSETIPSSTSTSDSTTDTATKDEVTPALLVAVEPESKAYPVVSVDVSVDTTQSPVITVEESESRPEMEVENDESKNLDGGGLTQPKAQQFFQKLKDLDFPDDLSDLRKAISNMIKNLPIIWGNLKILYKERALTNMTNLQDEVIKKDRVDLVSSNTDPTKDTIGISPRSDLGRLNDSYQQQEESISSGLLGKDAAAIIFSHRSMGSIAEQLEANKRKAEKKLEEQPAAVNTQLGQRPPPR